MTEKTKTKTKAKTEESLAESSAEDKVAEEMRAEVAMKQPSHYRDHYQDQQMRLEAVRLACVTMPHKKPGSAKRLIASAATIYEFINGEGSN